jgi:hypothetical protein
LQCTIQPTSLCLPRPSSLSTSQVLFSLLQHIVLNGVGPFPEGNPLNKAVNLYGISKALFALIRLVSDTTQQWNNPDFVSNLDNLFTVPSIFRYFQFPFRFVLLGPIRSRSPHLLGFEA